jgi:hypothetical protein
LIADAVPIRRREAMGIAMVAYELNRPDTWAAKKFDNSFEQDDRQSRFLPWVYCPGCRGAISADPIPEAYNLASDHPFWNLLQQAEAEVRRREAEGATDAEEALWNLLQQADAEFEQLQAANLPLEHFASDALQQAEAECEQKVGQLRLTPEEFAPLAAALRKALALPPKRAIEPGARLGLLPVCWKSAAVADFMWCVPFTIVVSERAVEVFDRGGLTGWEVWPLRVTRVTRSFSPPSLYELLFMGEAGDPAPESVPYQIEECPRRHAVTREISGGPHRPFWWYVNPDTWDGTDFFCFRGGARSSGYISERAKQVIEAAKLTNVAFRAINEPRTFQIEPPPPIV